MGLSLLVLEHRRNEEILEEARVEPIAMVMRRLEWFGQVKRIDETEKIGAVAEMNMKRKRLRGRSSLRWKDTIRRAMKAWKTTDIGRNERITAKAAIPHRETTANCENNI